MLVVLFTLLAPFTPFLDFYFAHLFYTPGQGFYDNVLFYYLFKYGELFGIGTGALAAVIFLASFFSQKWKKWRQGALAMGITLALGAGLITNMGLKEYWGRPRPKQVIEFGGKHEYRPFWNPNFHTRHDPQRSFPSGHVAMGFYFLSLYLVGRRYNNRVLKQSGLFLVVFLGGGLMIARMAQGGHFFSDVLFSPLLMWYVAKGADWLIFDSMPTWGAWGGPLLGLSNAGTAPTLEKQ